MLHAAISYCSYAMHYVQYIPKYCQVTELLKFHQYPVF